MSWLKIFAIVVVLKAIFWVLLIPLWHTPDEQAHFGHVAYLAEGGDPKNHGRYSDMTEEIYASLTILGTQRDDQGNNKFTFHPEYHLPYSDNFYGPQEAEINSLPLETRKNFVIAESAYYPHFYYQISGIVYKLFYHSNLFIRVFAVRLFWLWAHALTVWLAYKIAELIFPKNPLVVIAATVMTAFQPMFSFVAAGVTSDNLHNLMFTAVIYFSLKIIKTPRFFDFLALAAALGIGIVNKQQFLVAFVIVFPAILYNLVKYPKKTFKLLLVLPMALVLAFVLAPNRTSQLVRIFVSGGLPYLNLKNASDQAFSNYSLFDHLAWTLQHTIREVIPWYWGVFNWLGVVFPITVIRILNRLMMMAGLGVLIRAIQVIRTKRFRLEEKLLVFIAWSALAYFLSLTVWDWTFTKNNGFPFGVQGRYHFPVLVSHMILLTVGIRQLFLLVSKKAAKVSLVTLIVGIILLNFLALYIVAGSYYDLSGFQSFIIQASQYKPWFVKGVWLSLALTAYVSGSILLIYQLVKLAIKTNEK